MGWLIYTLQKHTTAQVNTLHDHDIAQAGYVVAWTGHVMLEMQCTVTACTLL